MRRALFGGVICSASAGFAFTAFSWLSPGEGRADDGVCHSATLDAEEKTEADLSHDHVVQEMTEAIIERQPIYRRDPAKASSLASIIHRAAMTHSVNPFVALAMAHVESAFHPWVGSGRRRGSRGEEGYFQVMPRSRPWRVCGRGRSMFDTSANADTALCYFARLREVCQTDDLWVLVSAYSRNHCPKPWTARWMRGTKNRRKSLCSMVGEQRCNEIWPR